MGSRDGGGGWAKSKRIEERENWLLVEDWGAGKCVGRGTTCIKKIHQRSTEVLPMPPWALRKRRAFLWTCDSFLLDRYELKMAIPEGKQIVLYPDKDEPKHILNIKRGILSALLVPPETEEDKQVLFLVRILEVNNSSLCKVLFPCQRPASP